MKLILYSIAASLLLATGSTGSANSGEAIIYFPANSVPSHPSLQAHYKPPSRKSVGQPTGRNRGAGSRGDCLKKEGDLDLTALTSNDPQITISAIPTLWFYIPYMLSPRNWLRFTLREEIDKLGTTRYESKISIPTNFMPGVVSIQAPRDLKVGKAYQWTLEIFCQDPDGVPNQDTDYVNGVLERIQSPVQVSQQLRVNPNNPRQQMLIYAQNGIWFDALHILAILRRARPQNPQLLDDWRKMLRAVGVEDVSEMPLRSCCDFPKKE